MKLCIWCLHWPLNFCSETLPFDGCVGHEYNFVFVEAIFVELRKKGLVKLWILFGDLFHKCIGNGLRKMQNGLRLGNRLRQKAAVAMHKSNGSHVIRRRTDKALGWTLVDLGFVKNTQSSVDCQRQAFRCTLENTLQICGKELKHRIQLFFQCIAKLGCEMSSIGSAFRIRQEIHVGLLIKFQLNRLGLERKGISKALLCKTPQDVQCRFCGQCLV